MEWPGDGQGSMESSWAVAGNGYGERRQLQIAAARFDVDKGSRGCGEPRWQKKRLATFASRS